MRRAHRSSIPGISLALSLILAPALLGPGCAPKDKPTATPRLLVTLPDFCNTPDGMCLLPSGDIILSVPNVNDPTQPAVLVKVTPDNRAELFFKMPPGPKTQKAFPMGVCVAPSGDLYVADNQWFANPKDEARVLRIPMKDGKPQEAVLVATGFVISNAVAVHDGYLYVTDSVLMPDSKPLTSGVLRFKLGEENVILKQPLIEDPHLVATLTTQNEKVKIGADGMTFDKAGNMYIGNFGDGLVHKFTFGADGKATGAVFARSDKMKSADGLFYHAASGRIIVADFMANAIHAVAPDGTVKTLASNADGALKGAMDSPCEALVRGNEIIVSNMDMPFGDSTNKKFERPAVLSALPIE
jgi:sugar lactone lactonase YvrE